MKDNLKTVEMEFNLGEYKLRGTIEFKVDIVKSLFNDYYDRVYFKKGWKKVGILYGNVFEHVYAATIYFSSNTTRDIFLSLVNPSNRKEIDMLLYRYVLQVISKRIEWYKNSMEEIMDRKKEQEINEYLDRRICPKCGSHLKIEETDPRHMLYECPKCGFRKKVRR